MPQSLFFATAKVNGSPMGAFLLANNADDAASKASAQLPPDAKITHLVSLCDARLGHLKRNGLLAYCPPADQIKFVQETLLDIIDVQLKQIAMMRHTIGTLMYAIKVNMNLKQFKFTVIEGQTGLVQIHEFLAKDLEQATEIATDFAKKTYHKDSVLQSIQEVERT